VRVVGIGNLPGRVAIDASAMYASNLVNLLTHFWDKEEKKLNLNLDDEILKGCVLTHGGSIVNERIRQHHKIS
jgi:NAD(P) transhydrogenase subunit alpha